MEKRKKILFITNIPSPYRTEFFDELGKYSDLTVLYEKNNADDRDWECFEKTNYTSVFMKGIKTGADNALCFEIFKYLKKKYDVIVVGGYSTPTGMLAIEYLNLNKIPFYLNCDGGFIKHEKKIKYIIKKHFIGSATYWLSSGRETNKYLKHYGAEEKRIYNYPFTSIKEVDVLKERVLQEEKETLKVELKIKEDKVVIAVGQFIYRKGFDLLIKASALLDENVGVYIIGGIPTEEYRELINMYQVKNVHFIKFCDKETLYKYYRIADCMAFPTREDIWGLVINEAMANGVPVISTNKCIAAMELVGDAGEIIINNDVETLYMAIRKVIYNTKTQNDMAEKALVRIKNYTIENMARVHMKIFEK